jgi:large subunit ribosomal protein L23
MRLKQKNIPTRPDRVPHLDARRVTYGESFGGTQFVVGSSCVPMMSGAHFWESLASKTGRAVWFPNIPLRLVAPSPEAAAKGLDVVTFITVPKTSKTEVRNLLRTVYNIGVDRVHTANYEGKKKRQGNHFYHRPDYKKVYVKLTERWFPPNGFAIQALDGDAEKGHKEKVSPVKSGNKPYWLVNEHDADGER